MSHRSYLAFAGLLGLACTAATSVLAQEAAAPAVPADGKAIFMSAKCNMCHAVPAQGIQAKATSDKMKGPDLAGVAAEPAELVKFLRKQAERNGATHKNEFKGTDEELQVLVKWVLEQK
jgi:cytochrome c5